MEEVEVLKPRVAYRPGHTPLHRLHPLVKFAWLLFATVLVFARRSPWLAAGALGLVVFALVAFRLSLAKVRGTRLFFATALTLGLFQLLFVDEGALLWSVGPVGVTDVGLESGIYVAARFLFVVLLSYLFVLTTDPNELAYGLMQVGLPYRYGFALITALRLVPLFEQEGEIVYQAQLARGVRYDAGGPRRFLTLGRQFFLPMLVSALGKVDALAVSMEGRCFGKYPTRTYLREVHFTRGDAAAAAALLLVLALSLWLR
jgi:energy-coupling factor transport system permease protein